MEALSPCDLFEEPDVSHLVTEDDEPVDSVFSEKQMRLLTSTLLESWKPGRPFVALANVGLFPIPQNPALVPDVMVSLGVTLPEDIFKKGNRSYMVWRYGKPPDLVIEIVSNRTGGELDKAGRYAEMGVSYYVVFDPEHHLGGREVRAYVRHGSHFVDLLDPTWIEDLGLGLRVWEGTFEDMEGRWLRPCEEEGNLLPTPAETAEAARIQAEEAQAEAEAARIQAEEAQAEAEAAQAEAEAARSRSAALEAENERLRARMRELGLQDL